MTGCPMKLKGTGRVLKHSSFPGNKRRITRRPPSVFFERTPETLRKSERKFRTYLENTSDLIVIVDINRIVRYASPSLKRILGYEPEEIVGRMVSFVYPDDAHLLAEPRIQSRLHPGIPMGPLEVRHLHKDGSIRYLELTGTFFIDESGEGYTVMNCRDTTERRLAEDALRIARLQLETATDLTGVVYWEVDEEKKEFVFNDAFYALYATTAEQEGGYRMPVVRLKEFIFPMTWSLSTRWRKRCPTHRRIAGTPLWNTGSYAVMVRYGTSLPREGSSGGRTAP